MFNGPNEMSLGSRKFRTLYDAATNTVSWVVNGVTVLVASATGVSSLVRTGVKRFISAGAKVGATSGWVAGGGAVNTGLCATLPASQTAATLVIPIAVEVGETITGFYLAGQIESAGGTVTLDAVLRKVTSAAADVVDASVGAITQLSVTADAIISVANAGKTDLSEVVGEDESFYLLVTGTTAGSTDIALQGVGVISTKA